jgi:hypothetical protein
MPGRTIALITLGVLPLIAGCGVEGHEQRRGSGIEASETRQVDSFDRVALSGQGDVEVSVGRAQSVTVRTDDNLLDDVRTEVDDGELKISQPGNLQIDPKVGITIEITVPDLRAVDLSGSGNVSAHGVHGDLFRAEVGGAGNVEATGLVQRVEAELSGSGWIRFAELKAPRATAEIPGSGNIEVYAGESLTASVSGAGQILYSGNPSQVEKDVSGAGDIRPA